MPTPHEERAGSHDLLAELQQVRDQIRLDLHLAGMEAKSTWETLGREVYQAQSELRRRGHEITADARTRVSDLSERMRAFIDDHLEQADDGAPRIEPIAYGYTLKLEGASLDDVDARTRQALADEGFGVLTQIDMQKTMKDKLDRSIAPYRILGACNPPLAASALEADPYVGLLLPCNVVIQERDGAVEVSALSPEKLLLMSGADGVHDLADDAESRLLRALGAIAAGAS